MTPPPKRQASSAPGAATQPDSIVWLASYPRSGNTWLRMMVAQYLWGDLRAIDDLDELVRPIERQIKAPIDLPERAFMKTHYALSPAHPMLDRTERAIVLVRDVRDVIRSTIKYFTMMHPEAPIRPPVFAKRFIKHRGHNVWAARGYGTWPEHAASWIADPGFPVKLVRYEDLRAHTERELAGILAFMGEDTDPEPDADRVARAVERSSLARAQGLELEFKERGPGGMPGTREQAERGQRFFNEGRTGQGLDDIEPGLTALCNAAFGPALKRFGYQ